jgi:hypothetical protein
VRLQRKLNRQDAEVAKKKMKFKDRAARNRRAGRQWLAVLRWTRTRNSKPLQCRLILSNFHFSVHFLGDFGVLAVDSMALLDTIGGQSYL